jgi:hypothetical protein
MIRRFVRLPGMDATGMRFADFVRALPRAFSAKVVRYPNDRSIPASCLKEVQRLEPQVEITGIEGSHLIFQREPEMIAEAIAGLVQQLA